MPRVKTTKEERTEIVKYCQNHDWDYKETAHKYGVSYSQVYSWCKKFRETGDDGLNDRRGHRKAEEDLTETEKLEREIAKLKRQLYEAERENNVLKKVRALTQQELKRQGIYKELTEKHEE